MTLGAPFWDQTILKLVVKLNFLDLAVKGRRGNGNRRYGRSGVKIEVSLFYSKIGSTIFCEKQLTGRESLLVEKKAWVANSVGFWRSGRGVQGGRWELERRWRNWPKLRGRKG